MKKTAIIIGASGGIGSAIAESLAQDYNIVASYCSREDSVKELVTRLKGAGYTAVPFQADITNSHQATALAASAVQAFGSVNLLVNCAGCSLQALVTDTSDLQYDRVMSVNMAGVFYACRAVLPFMIQQKSGGIINISSMWGQVGASCEAIYSASKAAVIGFTKALAKEVGPSGIAVNCVAPGLIDTEMNQSFSEKELDAFAKDTPLGKMGTPADIARAVRYLAADSFTTGQVLAPNGGAVIG